MKWIVVTLLTTSSVLAEYRVYEYMIQNKVETTDMPTSQKIMTTLPPRSYRAYHGGESIAINVLRTWICPGHTGNRRPLCDSPYAKLKKLEETKNELQ